MPRIREYVAQVLPEGVPQGRRATAADFGGGGLEGLGEGLSRFAAKLAEQEERNDVNDAYVKIAKAHGEWTVHLDERSRAAQPGDPTFADAFNTDLTDYLEQARGTIKTRAGLAVFERHAAELQSSLVLKARAWQAQSAGEKAKIDYTTFTDSLGASLITDPTRFAETMKLADAALSDPSGPYGRLDGITREELRKDAHNRLGRFYFDGLIQNGAGELAKRQLMAGEGDKFLKPETKDALLGKAGEAIRAEDVERHRQEAEAKQAKAEAEAAAADEYIKRIYGEGQKVTAKDILRDDRLDAGSREHLLRLMETRAREWTEKPVKTDPRVMLGLYKDIREGKLPDTKSIDAYYLGGKLSYEDMRRLRGEWADARSPDGERLGKVRQDFVERYKRQIDKSNPMMGFFDQTGGEQLYRFEYYIDQKVNEYRQAGKNPYDLFNPSAPEFLGKAVPQFQKSLTESAKEAGRMAGGGAGGRAAEGKAEKRKSLDDIFKAK